MASITVKVALAGECGSGKTSLIAGLFSDDRRAPRDLPATMHCRYQRWDVGSRDDVPTYAHIWDASGQERLNAAVAGTVYRNAHVVLLVFDVCNRASFHAAVATTSSPWIVRLRQVVPRYTAVIVVGNKADVEDTHRVSFTEAQRAALSIGATYVETSARTGAGVEALFLQATAFGRAALEASTTPQSSPFIVAVDAAIDAAATGAGARRALSDGSSAHKRVTVYPPVFAKEPASVTVDEVPEIIRREVSISQRQIDTHTVSVYCPTRCVVS